MAESMNSLAIKVILRTQRHSASISTLIMVKGKFLPGTFDISSWQWMFSVTATHTTGLVTFF